MFIASNASLVPNVDFKCSLLVKKGQDIEKLSFVSYKVDYFEDKCALLEEEEFWDPGVQIRPFVVSATKPKHCFKVPESAIFPRSNEVIAYNIK